MGRESVCIYGHLHDQIPLAVLLLSEGNMVVFAAEQWLFSSPVLSPCVWIVRCRSGTPIVQGLNDKGFSTVGTNQWHTYGVPVGDIPNTTCLHCFTDHRQVMTYEVGLGYLRCCCG